MGISRYQYLHYDVFIDRRFTGNQLAVFPQAAGLSARSMQQIAREIGFAETTFVTPPERQDTDIRMRIFTPGTELPMAGHPVIGSTFALAREGRIGAGRTDWVFGLNIGPTSVTLEWRAARLLDFEAYVFTTDAGEVPEQGTSLLNLQGVKLGRPSWIHISIDSSNGEISRVRIGGTSVFVAEGTMELED